MRVIMSSIAALMVAASSRAVTAFSATRSVAPKVAARVSLHITFMPRDLSCNFISHVNYICIQLSIIDNINIISILW